jgi:hypothetical protein
MLVHACSQSSLNNLYKSLLSRAKLQLGLQYLDFAKSISTQDTDNTSEKLRNFTSFREQLLITKCQNQGTRLTYAPAAMS